ncbi:zinc metalloprotease, partial [bacterium CG17_big_fil_post_rev_8_21_14_2_50_64_8]
MVKFLHRSLLCLFTLSLLFTVAGATADVAYLNDKGQTVVGPRCGIRTPAPMELERNALAVERLLEAGFAMEKAIVTIPVAVHVVRLDDGSCDVTDTQIADQMIVLNDAYAGYGFQFSLASVDRTDNTKWSTHRYGSVNERRMKEALAIDPAHNFNLYFCNIGGGLLGYATFPDMYPEDSYMHGVVALYASVPGGAAVPYDEGDTVTHEAGHFLGL